MPTDEKSSSKHPPLVSSPQQPKLAGKEGGLYGLVEDLAVSVKTATEFIAMQSAKDDLSPGRDSRMHEIHLQSWDTQCALLESELALEKLSRVNEASSLSPRVFGAGTSRRSSQNTAGLPKAAVEKCREICQRMQGRIKEMDPFVFEQPAQQSASHFRTKTTVGMMLKGCIVDSLVVGGPSYNSRQLDRGDVVVKVDGEVVDNDTILNALIGNDVPGSEVLLTIYKGGKQSDMRVVTLHRMATERIADRRRAFELFTLLKDRANQLKDEKIPLTVDKCISLWTNMLVSDAHYQEKAMKRFKGLQDQCTRLLDGLSAELDQVTTLGNWDSMSERVTILEKIDDMQADLKTVATQLQHHIDDERAQFEFQASPRHRASPPSNGTKSDATTHMSLKEQVTRDAIERGVLRAERRQEQKVIARLEYEVSQYKSESERWQQEAEKAKMGWREAKKKIQENAAREDALNKKVQELQAAKEEAKAAHDSSVREEGELLKHLHQSREEGERLEHSLQARETFVQRLEENLMTCQNDKLALQETFFTLQDQFRALEKEVGEQGSQQRMVMQSHLKEQEDQINGLKHELVMRTDAHVKKLWKLERALESLEDSMQKMTSMNESSTAQSQPYAKIIAKMNEEGRALDSALRALLDKLETSWTGPCLEKDEETAITPRSRLFQEKLWGHEPADILGISQQALDHCHKSMEQGNERSLADGSSYQHFAIAAKTLDKVHKQVAVLAKMYENAAANEAMWQTEAKQIQNQLGVVVKGHEKATARGNELQVDAQRAGERLDELLDVMSAAGINGREDLLLLVKRAEESVQLKKASPVLSLNREAKDKIKHFEHKWQEAAQEVENLKTTNRMILAERNGFEEQRRREYEAAEKNLRQVRGEREILKEMQQSHEGQRRLEHLLQESESSIRELEASLMMCQKSKLDTEAKRKDFERKWQESVHEGAKLKAVNSMLLTDISSLEKELSAVKADLNQTRTVNARLSMLAEDVERENRSYRAKGSTPGVPSSAGQATVDANPRSHIPPRTPRDSRNGTPRDLYREFLDDDRWSKLELAKKRLKQQDEEIKELKGYCAALQSMQISAQTQPITPRGMLGIA